VGRHRGDSTMTPPVSFDDRARTLTHSLLTDAERLPSRLPRERDTSAPWKSIAVFAATALVISGAVVGASIALRSAPVVKPIPASPAGHWKSFQLSPTGSSLSAVSCPDAGFCVAVDYRGEWFVSTDPGGGAHAWKLVSGLSLTNLPTVDVTTGLSCVGHSLCVAVFQQDHRGYIISTATLNPSANRDAQVIFAPDGRASLTRISCPTPALCIAVGGTSPSINPSGVVFAFTFPDLRPATRGATFQIDAASELTAISCATVKFCVATDGVGDVVTSTNPSGGVGGWHVTKVIGAHSFTAISCPSVHFCVAVDSNGQVVTSTDPTGGSDAWTATTLDGSVRFDSVSCPSARFCVAGGLSDSAYVSTDPTGGSGGWTKTRVIARGTENMFGLSCPSTRFCVGVDGADGVHVYTTPSR
jgi:hypothetical protein